MRTAFCVVAAFMLPRGGSSQPVNVPSTAAVLGVNVIVGGLASATWAIIKRHDAARAFGLGALGGAMHFGGKYVASRRGTLSPWGGLVISGIGTSIVANAGDGVSPLEELSIPVASLRLRLRPTEGRARVSLNAFESAEIIRYVARAGLRVSWQRSAQTGTLVTYTRDLDIVLNGTHVDGVTSGPAIALEPLAGPESEAIWKHEGTHVLQNWFGEDAVGHPAERLLRDHFPLLRRLPEWLDLGIAYPALGAATAQLVGRKRIDNLVEAEAYFMQRP
jgi:hypothetical protein